MITAGKLNKRITIEEPAKAQGAEHGEAKIEWVQFWACWAELMPLGGNERFTNDQVSAEVSHRIRIRYKEGITPEMRVLFKDRILNIESAVNIAERNNEMVLNCIEQVN